MSDMDPGAAARMATGEPEDELNPVEIAPAKSEATGGGSRGSLIDGLLETSPDSSVSQYPDTPEYAAHTFIGITKFINGIARDRDMKSGKPAIVNFAEAVMSYVSAGDSGERSEPEPEPEPRPQFSGGVDLNE